MSEPWAHRTAELFEHAPCGLVLDGPDEMIIWCNDAFAGLVGRPRDALVDQRRLIDLLAPGDRLYHETNVAPVLRLRGSIGEVAADLIHTDGRRIPVLLSAVRYPQDGDTVLTAVFEAAVRRQFEDELVTARTQAQEVAVQLQRSMLTGAAPRSDRFESAAVYRPAVSSLEVGGDWHDAFWLEDGRVVGLVVGDVVGRGLSAATAMGQLRSAVRALALTGLGPAALLEGLDRYSRRHAVGEMTTVAYAELRLDTAELVYACAGHPPPVLVSDEDPPGVLWNGRSSPLNATFEPEGRTEGRAALPARGTVLLFTDGLVERRTVSVMDGIETVQSALGERRAEPIADVVNGIVRDMRDREHPDDVCLLAARWSLDVAAGRGA